MSEKSGFVWAVRTGDLATVQDAVNKGENVNAVDATVNKRTPLHHAADFGQTEVINFLLSKGAKVRYLFIHECLSSITKNKQLLTKQ